MDEDILMQQVAEGDMQAFRRLVTAYQPRLLRFARRMLPTDRTFAEDVVQEAFVRLWHTRSRYQATGQLGCFLLRIVRNLCLDAVRDAPPALSLETTEDLPAPGGSLHQQAEARALVNAVRRAVQELPELQRSVFVLSHYEGLSYAEIARTLECPVGTVASRKRLAVETLRRRLGAWNEGEDKQR
jgi:RNA polymerase sigma-70 factor (ECF subfamily)